jgi:hypothetical protein
VVHDDEEFRQLRAALGGEPPDAVRALTAAQLRDLTAAIADARRGQRDVLAASGDRALRHIPRLLRGPVRRIMG